MSTGLEEQRSGQASSNQKKVEIREILFRDEFFREKEEKFLKFRRFSKEMERMEDFHLQVEKPPVGVGG